MKKDQDKTKEQLISELEEMRQRVAESETMETERCLSNSDHYKQQMLR